MFRSVSRHSARLKIEQLEERLTPSPTGITWPDPGHLTLSFAPDKTDVGGTPSALYKTLNAVASTPLWQHEILRALQTWAVNGNINVSVAGDGGQPFGTAGAIEGDSRFGDIRIGAKPLPTGTLATGTMFDWSGTTWSGDIVLNTKVSFGVNGGGQYDLFSVVLHEAGHVFGLDDSAAAPSSVMYQAYNGVRAGLSHQDVAAVQALYGVRASDAYDQQASNNSQATAIFLANGSTGVAAVGDMSSTSDADYYKFTTPLLALGMTGFAAVVQTSKFSSLLPTLTVYDSAGHSLGSATAVDPTNGDLLVQVSNVKPATTYYAKVGHASNDVFAIGSYHFGATYLYSSILTTILGNLLTNPWDFVTDNHLNDTLASATGLSLTWGKNQPDGRFQYFEAANIGSSHDVDYYQVQSPSSPTGAAGVLVAIVWAADTQNPLQPRVNVFDANSNPVPVQILANGNGTYTVQVPNTVPNASYYLKVSALNPTGPNNTGNYFLGVKFHNEAPVSLDNLAAGTLKTSATITSSLSVSDSELFNFALSASNSASQGFVTLALLDAQGRTVFALTANSAQPTVTATTYLTAGTYTIRYQAGAANGAVPSPINFWLDAEVLSDPLGAYTTSPSSNGSSSAGGGSSYTYSGSNSSQSPPPPRQYYY